MSSPIYIRIHNDLKESIEKGKWQVGDRIPAERELAEKYGVSRMTLRQAVQTLVDEGILERRVGSGTFVAREKVQEKMSGTTSFTQLMENQGKTPSSKTISYQVTTPSLSEQEHLKLSDHDNILRMERIRYADEVPICFEVATLPYSLVKNYQRSQITRSLYQTLQEHGLEIGHAQQTVSASSASEKIADYLKIKRGAPVLKLRQITKLTTGLPFEYVRTEYAGERFEFYLEK